MKVGQVIAVCFVLVSCGDYYAEKREESDRRPPEDVTYVQLREEIFQPRCFSCHSANIKRGNLDLSDYDGLVGGGTVIVGEPKNSSLYLLVENNSMPLGRSPLSELKKKKIYQWIEKGAPYE